jgi:HEAT repeat protein
MSFLALLWAYALSLAAIAIAGMTALILRRVVREQGEARQVKERQALIAALLTPNSQSSGASIALLDGETIAETLLEVLTLVRGADRDRIVEAARNKGAHLVLWRQLASGLVRNRILAAEALAFFPEAQTRRALQAAQNDIDTRVQVAALKSVIALGAQISIDDLLARIGLEGNRRLSALAGALRMAVASQPNEAIAALVRPDLATPVRIALIDSLAAALAGGSVDVIAALADDQGVEVRAAAIQALGVLAHPGGAPIIAKSLLDQDWRIRLKAAEAAGRLGLLEFTEPLCALLSDDNWWVRFRASEALAALGENGIAALRAIAASGEQGTARRAAALALLERAAA